MDSTPPPDKLDADSVDAFLKYLRRLFCLSSHKARQTCAPYYPNNPLENIKADEFDLNSQSGFEQYLQRVFSSFSSTSRRGEDTAVETFSKHQGKDLQENETHPAFDWDDNVYDFNHPKRGLAIIINNENFRKNDKRDGSICDAEALYESFVNLGFDVVPFDDVPARHMSQILKAGASHYNHRDADCFACAILSHGNQQIVPNQKILRDIIYGSDDNIIATEKVIKIFDDSNCPTLMDKPRLFFIQACRGNDVDDGVTVTVKMPRYHTPRRAGHRDDKDAVQGTDLFKDLHAGLPPLYPHCLIMYASPPGYFAFRRKTTGSWFIQSLCKILDGQKSQSTSLQHMLTRVSSLTATMYESNTPSTPETHGKKEMPVMYSMLLKDILISSVRIQ